MQPLINDATTALLRAIRVSFVNFAPDCILQVEAIRSRPWASVTFAGARYELTFCLVGAAAAEATSAWAATLDSAEFKLRGHILADIVLVSSEPAPGGQRLRVDALTVADE